MKQRRLIGVLLMILLTFSGCTSVVESAEGTFQTRVDNKQVISQRAPANNETVCLLNDVVTNFLNGYTFGKGLTVAEARDQDLCLNVPVTLSWSCTKDNTGYTLIYTTKQDFSDAVQIDTSEPEVELQNLLVATTYYWQVVTHTAKQDYYSTVFCFTTKDTPRFLSIEGVSNARDFGGYLTEDGKYAVAQGKLYRGARLDNITGKGRDDLKKLYNVKTDFDLRDSTDSGALIGESSPVGDSVKYINIGGVGYLGSLGSETFRDELLTCMASENYPIFIHCTAGRDRTGILMFHLGALLGLPKDTLLADFEMTYLSAMSYPSGDLTGHDKMVEFIKRFENLEGETYQEKAEKFWLSNGITAEQIQAFRDAMLEKVEE